MRNTQRAYVANLYAEPKPNITCPECRKPIQSDRNRIPVVHAACESAWLARTPKDRVARLKRVGRIS